MAQILNTGSTGPSESDAPSGARPDQGAKDPLIDNEQGRLAVAIAKANGHSHPHEWAKKVMHALKPNK